jgi:hypothetical protein
VHSDYTGSSTEAPEAGLVQSLASVYGVLIGRIGRSVFRENYVSRGKLRVSLRFEQQRFYNPHHHPEMHEHFHRPTEGLGTAKTKAGCTMIRLYFVGTSDSESIGDTFEREDLLRSVE